MSDTDNKPERDPRADICPICKILKKGEEVNLSPLRYVCFGIVLDAMTGSALADMLCNEHAADLATDYMVLAAQCFADADRLEKEGSALLPDDTPTVPDIGVIDPPGNTKRKKDMN